MNLSNLPPELRLEIYRHVLTVEQPIIWHAPSAEGTQQKAALDILPFRQPPFWSLLLASLKIHNEAFGMLYRHNTVHFRTYSDFHTFVIRRPQHLRSTLRSAICTLTPEENLLTKRFLGLLKATPSLTALELHLPSFSVYQTRAIELRALAEALPQLRTLSLRCHGLEKISREWTACKLLSRGLRRLLHDSHMMSGEDLAGCNEEIRVSLEIRGRGGRGVL
ncbi:hypothetical protein LTR85_009082 [Meristemomyces frigidus]|nr:hypothetical protein LTR85_009082 [Meristemomyces frigidus]